MKRASIITAAILACTISAYAQLPRSKSFHEEYTLKEVVIFSRHNVRAPITGTGSSLESMTPHKWHQWSSPISELTLNGGVLETINGQFFRQWVESENLLPHNAVPSEKEVLFYANNKQRTIATSRYFCSGFLPVGGISVRWDGPFDKMNPMFDLSFHNIDQKLRSSIATQLDSIYGKNGLKRLSKSLKPNYALLSKVLDSDFRFDNHDVHLVLDEGDEPHTDASLNDALSAADALLLQYYECADPLEASFGHPLSLEQWRKIVRIKDENDHLRFAAPCLYMPLAAKIFDFIGQELRNPERRFTFICGHDTNIVCMLNALEIEPYEAPNAIEIRTPIGSKIVFERWEDSKGRCFIAVNHVYQSVEQMRSRSILSLDNPPMVISIKLRGIEANSDGLYSYEAFMKRIEAIVQAKAPQYS